MTTIPHFPSQIDFGPGSIARVAERVAALGRSAFVVTDPGVQQAGLCEPVLEHLRAAGIEFSVYGDVQANPTEADVLAASDAFRAAPRDVIVALGGGSAIDVAKGAALLATHEGAPSEYSVGRKGFERIQPGMPPLVAAPTTAGTGSEMSGAFVLTDPDAHAKVVVLSPLLKPAAVVLDPELTLSLPPRLTAVTGMDALAHAIESYLVDAYHPFADAQALGAVELIATSLPRAFADGQDRPARMDMLMAAALAGCAMSLKGLGAAHAVAHQIGGIPHGLANAIVLPHVMRFNAEAAGGKLARVARLLGVDTHGMTDTAAGAAAADAVDALCRGLRLERTGGEAGCALDDADAVARRATRDMCCHTNPRRCRRSDLKMLLQAAM